MKDAEAIPLSLFGTDTLEPLAPPLRERIRAVEWSYSRRNTLEQCPRRYYFEYYGSRQRAAIREPQKNLLRSLKRLQNRYERTGELAHQIIADYLRSTQRGNVKSVRELTAEAKRLFSAGIQEARSIRPFPEKVLEGSARCGLVEFYYQQDAALDLCKEAEQNMIAALENFVGHPRYERIRLRAKNLGVKIEQLFRLKDFPCRVTGVVDFAAQTKGVVGIVDWKTGKRGSGEEDSLQLAIYAQWGAEQFGCAAESVAVFKAFLGSGDLVRFTHKPKSLENARIRVLQDVERMVEIHSYGMEGRMTAFTACAQKKVCLLCPYAAVCPEGKECLYG